MLKMKTADETWNDLGKGPIYEPIKVWVVEHEVYAYRCLEVKPFDEIKGVRGLVWALMEATCVSRSKDGVSVTFFNGATGWFPFGNARLAA